ncbi:Putative serine/threonine-protein kinase [Glycine soja]|nr:Putative serine/threonine-protein kinase [Glycine soja]
MSPAYVLWFLLFSSLPLLLLSEGNANGHRDDCPDSFDCGSIGRIHFPFTTVERHNCGVLAIRDCNDSNQTSAKHVQLTKGGKLFQVTQVNCKWWWPCSISIIDQDFRGLLENGSCKALSYNITVPPSSALGYFYVQNNISIFNCSRHLRTLNHTNGFINYTSTRCPSSVFYFAPPDSQTLRSFTSSCSMVQLPKRIDSEFFKGDPFGFLTAEITFEFMFSDDCIRCHEEGKGFCEPDSNGKIHCATRKSTVMTRKIALILGPCIIVGLFLTLRHCKRKYGQSSNTCADSFPNPDTETDRIFFGVPVFSYKELQEATNNFDPTRKLGDGGFGTVYYGTLRDGREVAIKHLFEHNYKRVQQFMNEIEILTRLRHRNLVSLYGCTSRHGQELLLVYEYVPNGTVASHLHGDLARVGLLTWPIRMQIAIETATALAYLHASNIIHRDVKTNNILLDISFSVKVADFGLSRLMPAVDTVRERDEVNLANLAMKKIHKGKLSELVDPSFGFETDQQVKRVITSVAELAFRCIQADNELRPSMDEVLEALKNIGGGKFESEHIEKEGDSGGVISSTSTEQVHPPVEFLMNEKLPASPKSLTEKWESESTTPNASG